MSCRLELADVGYDCPDWQSLLDGLRPRQVDLDEMDPGPRLAVFRCSVFGETLPHRSVVASSCTDTAGSLAFAIGARLLDFPSWPCHLRPSHASLPNFSACFFSAACGFPCPCLLAPAGVAVHSTSLRGQVYWPVAASLSKALLQGCAGRQVPASPPTCSFGTWTCQSHVTMVDDWKSWLTGFHCSMVLSSPLTPHWFLQFVQTVSPGVSVLTWTALLLPKPVVSSSALIQSSRGNHGRARLVVLAAENGGRWSEEARAFVSQLAKAKARSVPRILAGRARQAWHHRWSSMLACASARAFALSLLDRRAAVGCDGEPPSSSAVVTECRHLRLDSTL